MDTQTVATTISAASALGALLAAGYAWRSSRVAKRAAGTATQQAHIQFVSMISEWQPSVTMTISDIGYRWSSNQSFLSSGKAGTSTDAGVFVDDLINPNHDVAKNLYAEIVINGQLKNNTNEELLLTFRGLKDSIRYPLQNEGLLLVGGVERSFAVLAPGKRLLFTWIDRRSFDSWRLLHLALANPSEQKYLGMKFADERLIPQLRKDLKSVREPEKENKLKIAGLLVQGSAFEIIAEKRMTERVATIWRAELRESAIKPVRSGPSDEILWKLSHRPVGDIDDNVLNFRYSANTALAQIEVPFVRRLPGRS